MRISPSSPPSPPSPIVTAPLRAWSPTPAIRASIWLHALALGATAGCPQVWPWTLGAVAANHLALGVAGTFPQNDLLGPNLARLPPAAAGRREVALTFDDGPDPAVTPAVLDALDRGGARASFFCIGRRAAAYPDLVREIVRRGHSVENHTDTHPYGFPCLPPGGITREVRRAQETIATIAGRAPRFFRAPMGLRTPLLDPVLARAGLCCTSWTRRGYDGRSGDAAAVLRRLGRGLAAGDVLLLHDGSCARTRAGRPVVMEVLPALLDQLAAAGLRPVALPAATG